MSAREASGSRWIWPLPPVPARARRFVDQAAGAATPLVRGWRWLPAGLAAGVLPTLVSYLSAVPGHQTACAFLLFPLFLACVRQGWPTRALLTVAAAVLAHSAVVIGLSSAEPARMAPLLQGAESFWEESRTWVETGANPEYAPARWLLKHLLLPLLVVVLGWCSLGLTVLLRAFYEVDLMNYYVGRLIAQSQDAPTVILYGWHVWSLVRGVGCALLLYEVAARSFNALVGAPPRRSLAGRLRLAAGIGLLVLDGLLKWLLMDSVQARLQANLL